MQNPFSVLTAMIGAFFARVKRKGRRYEVRVRSAGNVVVDAFPTERDAHIFGKQGAA